MFMDNVFKLDFIYIYKSTNPKWKNSKAVREKTKIQIQKDEKWEQIIIQLLQ